MNNPEFQKGDRIVVAYQSLNHRLKVGIEGKSGYVVALPSGDDTYMIELDDGTLTYISPEDLKAED